MWYNRRESKEKKRKKILLIGFAILIKAGNTNMTAFEQLQATPQWVQATPPPLNTFWVIVNALLLGILGMPANKKISLREIYEEEWAAKGSLTSYSMWLSNTHAGACRKYPTVMQLSYLPGQDMQPAIVVMMMLDTRQVSKRQGSKWEQYEQCITLLQEASQRASQRASPSHGWLRPRLRPTRACAFLIN